MSLSLVSCEIDAKKDIEVLGKLEKLDQLDLFGTPYSKKENYFAETFELLSGLEILDNRKKNEMSTNCRNEADSEEEEEGEFVSIDEEDWQESEAEEFEESREKISSKEVTTKNEGEGDQRKLIPSESAEIIPRGR